MSVNDARVRELIRGQAADWFVANRGGLSAMERGDFASWLRASPVNVEEYLRIAAVARDLRQACAGPENSVEAVVARARAEKRAGGESLWKYISGVLAPGPARLWQAAAVMTAAAFAGMYVGWLLWRAPAPVLHVLTPPAVLALHFQTRHGEQQTRRLADNSILHLNTDTSVTVRYSKTERVVLLSSGEAEFEVVHDSGRAFRVYAGPAQVVDVGTQFDVRLAPGSAVVTVVEGRVAVAQVPSPQTYGSTHPPLAPFVQLRAGQQIRVTEGDWPAKPITVEAQSTTAWLRGQIIFEHERLSQVAAEFNRYAPTPVEIAAPALRDLEISGVFATDDTPAFIAFLRSLDGVRVEVTATRILVLQN